MLIVDYKGQSDCNVLSCESVVKVRLSQLALDCTGPDKATNGKLSSLRKLAH